VDFSRTHSGENCFERRERVKERWESPNREWTEERRVAIVNFAHRTTADRGSSWHFCNVTVFSRRGNCGGCSAIGNDTGDFLRRLLSIKPDFRLPFRFIHRFLSERLGKVRYVNVNLDSEQVLRPAGFEGFFEIWDCWAKLSRKFQGDPVHAAFAPASQIP
jgi:hypothetical protein